VPTTPAPPALPATGCSRSGEHASAAAAKAMAIIEAGASRTVRVRLGIVQEEERAVQGVRRLWGKVCPGIAVRDTHRIDSV
jgi:hypothetical protein